MTCISVLFSGCTEDGPAPVSGSSGKPVPVEILSTDTLPGGVRVHYRIPPVNDILEIKAVYTLAGGKQRESSASYFAASLVIDGYSDTLEHRAQICVFNRAREMSEPVELRFRPGMSALMKAKNTMKIERDFGGVNFNWRNPDRQMLIFEFFGQNAQGDLATMNITASGTDSTDLSFRGFDTIAYKFAVNIRDHFGNESGMIYPEGGHIVPLFELKLDKSIQQVPTLPGDVSWNNWEGRPGHFIDNDITTIIHSPANTVPGATITLDLGRKVKLSRFLLWQRLNTSTTFYASSSPRIVEVYATDDVSDNPSGDWSAWKYIKTCTIVKPSGAPSGTVTEEDRVAALDGHDFAMPLAMAPTRYLRIRFMECWSASLAHVGCSEITAYGIYVD